MSRFRLHPPLWTDFRGSHPTQTPWPPPSSKLQFRPRAQGAVSHASGGLLGVLLEPAWEASCLLGSWESFGPSRVSGVSCLLLCLEIIWRRLGAIWGSGAICKPSWAVLKLLGPMSPCPMSTPSDAIRQNFWSNLLPPAAAGRRRPIRIEWTSPGGGDMGGGNHLTRRVPPRGRRNTLAPLRPCDPQEGG